MSVLFSRNFAYAYAKFRKNKTLTKMSEFTVFHNSSLISECKFLMNQMFWMMYWDVSLEMRSLSEWTVTKLTSVGLSASMYHIMPFHFVIVWKSFATIWARVATRFSRDRKELFPSTRCQWSYAVHCESVTCCYQIWNEHKNRYSWTKCFKTVHFMFRVFDLVIALWA